jgi:ferritin-like metal-binding protein YciE
MAKKLGYPEAVKLLRATLQEEQATDEKLGVLAQASQIQEAVKK